MKTVSDSLLKTMQSNIKAFMDEKSSLGLREEDLQQLFPPVGEVVEGCTVVDCFSAPKSVESKSIYICCWNKVAHLRTSYVFSLNMTTGDFQFHKEL